jgi:hypothetical protein
MYRCCKTSIYIIFREKLHNLETMYMNYGDYAQKNQEAYRQQCNKPLLYIGCLSFQSDGVGSDN